MLTVDWSKTIMAILYGALFKYGLFAYVNHVEADL